MPRNAGYSDRASYPEPAAGSLGCVLLKWPAQSQSDRLASFPVTVALRPHRSPSGQQLHLNRRHTHGTYEWMILRHPVAVAAPGGN